MGMALKHYFKNQNRMFIENDYIYFALVDMFFHCLFITYLHVIRVDTYTVYLSTVNGFSLERGNKVCSMMSLSMRL